MRLLSTSIVMLAIALVLAPRVAAAGEGAVFINIWEDANYGGQSAKITLNGEGSVPDLADLPFPNPIIGCHGADWPTAHPGWQNCISSHIPNWNATGCVQLWGGKTYTGTLLYSKTVRPGDTVPSADFTQDTMGTANDKASSIRLGSWTGTRNAGHCVWSA